MPHRSFCGVNRTLETIGDAWSLLIVRDMAFSGAKTYNEFLNAEEGIATNILSDRLKRLEIAGILEKRQDPIDGRRSLYQLTRKGIDLVPILVNMVLWGIKHGGAELPPSVRDMVLGDPQGFVNQVTLAWEDNVRQRGV